MVALQYAEEGFLALCEVSGNFQNTAQLAFNMLRALSGTKIGKADVANQLLATLICDLG